MTDKEMTALLHRAFSEMAERQAQWQDEIGFGEEGHRLRREVMRTAGLDPEDAMRQNAQAALRNYYMTKLGLIMTEASEAFDEMRNHAIGETYHSLDEQGNSKPEGVLSELADAIIRIWSLTGETKLSYALVEVIVEKLNYNKTRAHKHGGKAI